jgi:hypothetical protein
MGLQMNVRLIREMINERQKRVKVYISDTNSLLFLSPI